MLWLNDFKYGLIWFLGLRVRLPNAAPSLRELLQAIAVAVGRYQSPPMFRC